MVHLKLGRAILGWLSLELLEKSQAKSNVNYSPRTRSRANPNNSKHEGISSPSGIETSHLPTVRLLTLRLSETERPLPDIVVVALIYNMSSTGIGKKGVPRVWM